MRECADFRAQMVAYVRGELLPLERAHIESHIGRCRSCASLEKKTSRAFDAVDVWTPANEPQHLARLKKRLQPYVADAAPNRPALFPAGVVGLAAAAAVALALLLVPRGEEQPAPSSEVIAEAAPEPKLEERAIGESLEPVQAVLHREITRHLHVIAGRGWDGRVLKNEPEDMRVEMQKGFAVMAFRGGEGRKLTVFAPNVSVEVIGTKFFINVLANGTTAVGVVSGSVRVFHAGGSELVEAGISREYGDERPPMPAQPSATPAVDMEDAFIADHGHEEPVAVAEAIEPGSQPKLVQPEVAIAPPVKREPAPSIEQVEDPEPSPPAEPEAEAPAIAEEEPPKVSVGDLLAEAERLTRQGRVDDALAIYEGSLASDDEAITAQRALIRYELARLLGFEKKEVSRARDIFEHLTIAADGEVKTQAAFALCELDLISAPCTAAACLRRIARDPSLSGDVHSEAELLLKRWQIDRCDHN